MAGLTGSLKKVGLNGFFFALLGMILLARLFPFYGTSESPLPLSIITQYGVALIFFFYGLKLSPEKLRAGLANWRLHILIQTTTFILFPLIAWGIFTVTGPHTEHALWLGVLYLAALPSTVSSSVVMVSIAGGNLAAAIFNASISSILGIFITPVWMATFMDAAAGSVDIQDVIIKLSLQVLLPVVLGLAAHRWWGAWAERFKHGLRLFDQSIILLIVYTAFCESFSSGMFQQHSLTDILLLAAAMWSFFLFMALLMEGLGRLLKFEREDRISILFCGSKKSLVQGAVMGKVLFPDPVVMGVVLLPVMLYHALQLIVGSMLAERFASATHAQNIKK